MTADEAHNAAYALCTGSYGSFAAHIGDAYLVGDNSNKEKLLGAYSGLFETVLSYIVMQQKPMELI